MSKSISGTPIAGELSTDTPAHCSYCGKQFGQWDEELGEPYILGVYSAQGYPYVCCSSGCLTLAIGDQPAGAMDGDKINRFRLYHD